MVLEAEIADIQKRLNELDATIDKSTSETELNRIGGEIRELEDRLAPIRRVAAHHAEFEATLDTVKSRIERKRLRL